MRRTIKRDSKIEALRLVPALRAIGERDIARLSRLVDEVRVPAGTVLIHEGAHGRDAFVIAEGTARVTVGDDHVCDLGPGEIVGEMAPLERRPRTATVVADTPMRLLAIGAADFYAFARLPPVARAVTATLVARLRAADTRIRQLVAER
jgi:CRP/FNR family transcriptional regulator, cyclic AMP receptor protein